MKRGRGKKRVSVTLDPRTAVRVRREAGMRNLSLSRFIAEVLRNELEYQAAYRAWREDRKPFPLKGPPQPYPKREELYDRPLFRKG